MNCWVEIPRDFDKEPFAIFFKSKMSGSPPLNAAIAFLTSRAVTLYGTLSLTMDLFRVSGQQSNDCRLDGQPGARHQLFSHFYLAA